MAKISAWLAAVAAAAIVAAMAPYVRAFEFGSLGPLIAAGLLALAAWRTITRTTSDKRLLCAAWGVTAGLAWYAPSYNFPEFVPGPLAIAAPVLISAIGLALALLHQD